MAQEGELSDRSISERQVRALQEIAFALGSILDQDELLRVIMSKVSEILDAERSTLYILDPEKNELWSRVTQGGEIAEIRLKIPNGVAGWVAHHGEPVNIVDAYRDDRFNPEVDRRSGYRTRSMLTVPISNPQGRLVGVVQALNKKRGPFNASDEAVLGAIANQAAISLENSKLYSSLREQNEELIRTQRRLKKKMRELDLLYQMEKQLTRTEQLDDIMFRFVGMGVELLSADGGLAVTADRGRGKGFRAWWVENGRERRGVGAADEPDSLTRAVCERRRAHRYPADDVEKQYPAELADLYGFSPEEPLCCALCVPISTESGILGGLHVVGSAPSSFSGDEVKLLELVSGKAARAYETHRLKKERMNESRLAAIGRMLSSVLHDLKAPMTIVSGYAQMMASTPEEEVREKYSESILTQFEVMNDMIHEVVAFARGETNILARNHHVHEFFGELEPHLSQILEGKNVGLDIRLEYRNKACFDSVKMRRLVLNIARNAVQAMEEGGELSIRSVREGSELVLVFSDTGSGIDPDIAARIFDPFVTSRGSQGGSGLGLAIVKKIVDEHCGRVEFAGRKNGGTTFTVRLPLEGPRAKGQNRIRRGNA